MQAYFEKLRSNLELNETFDLIVQTRHAAVRDAIADGESKLVGSLQRRTRIQPRPGDRFDIDVLIIMGEFAQWVPSGGITPAGALNALFGKVADSDRYSKKNPERDAPTVSLTFADSIAVELIPAYRDDIGHNSLGRAHSPRGRGYWVPKGNSWELADYDFDAKYITTVNAATDGLLVPIIKMLKAIKRVHLPELKSFVIEILAAETLPSNIRLFRNGNVSPEFSSVLRWTMTDIATRLDAISPTTPIGIPGSLSPPIVLPAHVLMRAREVLGKVAAAAEQISKLQEREQVEGWRRIFGDVFPARVEP